MKKGKRFVNKAELTQEDLSKAIQFLKDNAISSDEVNLERLVGWLNNPISKFTSKPAGLYHNSLKNGLKLNENT